MQRVDSDVTPLWLWDNHISLREPVVIRGLPPDANGLNKWTNLPYLNEKAGKSSVSVELFCPIKKRFGSGMRKTMPFSRFLHLIASGKAEEIYISSGEQTIGPHGFPCLMTSPTKELSNDFPIRPKLTGYLVPQQINLWMGSSSTGLTSGLHHDYHDNLYVLLQGEKVFKLFRPHKAQRLHPVGKIKMIYPNGKIVYKGQEGILEDGSHMDDVNAWQQNGLVGLVRGNRSPITKMEKSNFEDPPNFSKVELKDVELGFPDFPHPDYIVKLSAGETLYLPAGWYHDVTSKASNGYHLALNYWFHPPDNLQPGISGFSSPYFSKFWSDAWNSGAICLHKRKSILSTADFMSQKMPYKKFRLYTGYR